MVRRQLVYVLMHLYHLHFNRSLRISMLSMFCLEKAPNDLLISSDEVPWINNQVDKFIGLNKFSCYSKSKVTSQEEIEALKKYADENPQSWKIRFKNKSKLSP